jgi:hypothetical protein
LKRVLDCGGRGSLEAGGSLPFTDGNPAGRKAVRRERMLAMQLEGRGAGTEKHKGFVLVAAAV